MSHAAPLTSTRILAFAMVLALAAALMPLAVDAKPKKSSSCQTTSVSGTVTNWKVNNKGHIDGLYLNSGSEIRFAPHEATGVDAIVDIGSSVSVSGCLKTSPSGASHIKMQSITNLGTGATYTSGSTSSSPPPPSQTCQATTVAGSVSAFRYNHKGHIDGLNLNDGTVVKFKPHNGASVDAIIDPGSPVSVNGCYHTGPAGDTHFKASSITNTATGQSVQLT